MVIDDEYLQKQMAILRKTRKKIAEGKIKPATQEFQAKVASGFGIDLRKPDEEDPKGE